MDEAKRKLDREAQSRPLVVCWRAEDGGQDSQMRWETESAATPMGQLAQVIESLNLTGPWSRWLSIAVQQPENTPASET